VFQPNPGPTRQFSALILLLRSNRRSQAIVGGLATRGEPRLCLSPHLGFLNLRLAAGLSCETPWTSTSTSTWRKRWKRPGRSPTAPRPPGRRRRSATHAGAPPAVAAKRSATKASADSSVLARREVVTATGIRSGTAATAIATGAAGIVATTRRRRGRGRGGAATGSGRRRGNGRRTERGRRIGNGGAGAGWSSGVMTKSAIATGTVMLGACS
jgi:hypothetical protein